MARRKGKSQRRIRFQHHEGLEETEHLGSPLQRLTRKAAKLPSWRAVEDAEAPISMENLPRREGMVTGLFPGGALVRSGQDELLCGVAGTFRPPENASALAVGDVVAVAITPPPAEAAGRDRDRADGMILSRQPRQTALARPRPRSGKRRDAYEDEGFLKVIAANMEQLLIVASTCQPKLRAELVVRFLIIAERGEMRPLLAVNKIDLAPLDEQVIRDLTAVGADPLLVSAVSGAGLEALRAKLSGRRTVLAGASGVGKSTLVNALVPGAEAATRPIRMKDHRGRHVTSAAAVYDLAEGGFLVDTPGVRELAVEIGAAELPWYFPEFERFSGQCHYRDCTHTHEPGCAVQPAVEQGLIPPQRYASYLRLREALGEE